MHTFFFVGRRSVAGSLLPATHGSGATHPTPPQSDVHLSDCRSLEGLLLLARLRAAAYLVHPIRSFQYRRFPRTGARQGYRHNAVSLPFSLRTKTQGCR